METKTRAKRNAFIDTDSCVACGCCVISVFRGVAAQVDTSRCVGCGRCAKECPASVIEIREVRA